MTKCFKWTAMIGVAAAAISCALIAGAVPGFAQAAKDPFVGTWKLNPSLSTMVPADQKSKIVVNSARPNGILITETVETTSGEKKIYKIPYVYGGKFTPQNVSPLYDMLAVERITPYSVHWTLRNKGKAAGDATQDVSKGEKILTMVAHIKLPTGEMVTQKSVFEKQAP